MSTELTLLAWCLVLAVVQILLPSILRTQETGPEYNASPRDSPSPVPEGIITGRLRRAQANLFETLPPVRNRDPHRPRGRQGRQS